MKKYTNKILIIAAAVFLAFITIKFFIVANEIKEEIRQPKTNELNINY
jgi:uncharacterized protein involved in outer membrane biogenesis